MNTLTTFELRALWRQWAADDSLPRRYEATEHGELVIGPDLSNRHQLVCSSVAFSLRSQLGGGAVTAAAVLTPAAGIRVPDVVWMPSQRWACVTDDNDLLQAPELVVEVLSPGEDGGQVAHKTQAYLACGIREVIVVALDGAVSFHRADGQHATSEFGVMLDLPREFFSMPGPKPR